MYSQLYQKQVAEDIQSRYLELLLKNTQLNINQVTVEPISDAGFCNNVYRIEQNIRSEEGQPRTTTFVAKIFSDLAKKRLDPTQKNIGEIDELLYKENIGPNILAHSSDALLMEYIDGKVLTESMLFDKERGLDLCKEVGDTLGEMHNLQGYHKEVGPNMLWHALDVMLSSCDENICLTTDRGNTWNLNELKKTIASHKDRLEELKLTCVPIGHGDFKVSNIIQKATGDIRLIDFELAGPHYRAYDLAKLFRSSSNDKRESTLSYKLAFLESYYWRTHEEKSVSTKPLAAAIHQLEWEVQLLEPMTWLEAASFFLCMATLDAPSEKEKWIGLAQRRLNSYEKMQQIKTKT